MTNRILITGNEAVGAGAVKAGCDCYYGYPITPQNELIAYMAKHMPAKDRVFIQAESEIAAISMVYGSAAAGKRTMTSSSSPGISLKQEGISMLAGAQLPAVIVNVQRGGPGLGNIAPAQSDYFQAVKGGGHGDYRLIVLAPDSVQEMHDLTILAFELADKYRSPVMILADGRLGQMMEPLDTDAVVPTEPPSKSWAVDGAKGRKPNMIRSLYLVDGELEDLNLSLQKKFDRISQSEVRYEEHNTEDCDILLVAYGSSARIAKGAVEKAQALGIKAGLMRPISLWPFPTERISALSKKTDMLLVVEMSSGQMLEDVKIAVNGKTPVYFEGRMGGGVPTVSDILARIEFLHRGRK